jgi:hypothetical protein
MTTKNTADRTAAAVAPTQVPSRASRRRTTMALSLPGSSNISGANELWEPGGEPACSDTRRRQATSSHGSRR